ncbi:NADH(P)-binding-domain-containing protein, partial [Umbelopsis sp. PMI_123]
MRVAVFGGSRGCAQAMVKQGLALSPPIDFTLLVRKPEQIDYTEEERAKIKLVQGSADDKEAVRQTLEGVDVVVFSIGARPTKTFQFDDPHVCGRCIRVVLEVMSTMENKPTRLVAVSTTGAEDKDEVPLLFKPLYHFMLATPHEDKRDMEKVIRESCPVDHVIVRPSLLTDGALTKNYRKASERLVGYTVSRQDIGHFLLTECL